MPLVSYSLVDTLLTPVLKVSLLSAPALQCNGRKIVPQTYPPRCAVLMQCSEALLQQCPSPAAHSLSLQHPMHSCGSVGLSLPLHTCTGVHALHEPGTHLCCMRPLEHISGCGCRP